MGDIQDYLTEEGLRRRDAARVRAAMEGQRAQEQYEANHQNITGMTLREVWEQYGHHEGAVIEYEGCGSHQVTLYLKEDNDD